MRVCSFGIDATHACFLVATWPSVLLEICSTGENALCHNVDRTSWRKKTLYIYIHPYIPRPHPRRSSWIAPGQTPNPGHSPCFPPPPVNDKVKCHQSIINQSINHSIKQINLSIINHQYTNIHTVAIWAQVSKFFLIRLHPA